MPGNVFNFPATFIIGHIIPILQIKKSRLIEVKRLTKFSTNIKPGLNLDPSD